MPEAENRRRRAAAVVVVLLAALACGGVHGSLRAPMNGRTLRLPRSSAAYSFLLAGHVYGSQNESVFPAASLLASIDRFNHDDIRFAILLGDILRRVNPVHIEAFERSFARQVRCPLFNAIGNHDEDHQGLYRKRFGPETYYSFLYASELFVVLDGEKDEGDIRGAQLDFLRAEVRRARETAGIRNLFVICHRLIWAIGNPPLDAIIPFVNGPDSYPPGATTFTRTVLPELRALGKPVFLVSGDVGASWSFPLFYQQDTTPGVTYVATGIGDTVDDVVLRVTVDHGAVRFEAVSLTGAGSIAPPDGKAPPLSAYGVDFWVRHFAIRTR